MRASASVDNSGAGTASASVDPTVVFDPNYTIPDGATITYSANLADTAVSEPASIALPSLGLFALAFVRRRR